MSWAQWNSSLLRNGVLYREWQPVDGKRSILQQILPCSIVKEVQEVIHGGTSGGHLCVKKTLEKWDIFNSNKD